MGGGCGERMTPRWGRGLPGGRTALGLAGEGGPRSLIGCGAARRPPPALEALPWRARRGTPRNGAGGTCALTTGWGHPGNRWVEDTLCLE